MVQYATRNYYSEERILYKEAYRIFVSNERAKKIMRKLCNHYELSFVVPIKFRGSRDGGCAYGSKIHLSNNPSVGLIMHEFTHYAQTSIMVEEGIYHNGVKNKGTEHHGSKFQACLNFVNQYCKSKKYWVKGEDEVIEAVNDFSNLVDKVGENC